jgi:hypothetical protein
MSEVSHGFHVFRDGAAWCAVGPHFIDLMQSKAGFGDTPEIAVDALKAAVSKEPWWRDKAFPDFNKFKVHQP